jgi:hypothetical protein
MRSTVFCLPCSVDLADQQLVGLLQVGDGSASFLVGDLPPLPPALVDPWPTSVTIEAPLGLDGVTLDGHLAGTISQQSVDIALAGIATINAQLALGAALVFENWQPRLVFVRLQESTPLTLTMVLAGMVGDPAWLASVTDQFAFVSGALSMLVAPSGATSDYHYLYHDEILGDLDFKPGFRANGDFLVFDHPFQVEMGVGPAINAARFNLPASYRPVATDMTVVGQASQPLTFDFGSLGEPYVGIAQLSTGSRLLFGSTGLTLFGSSPVLSLDASYDSGLQSFTGTVGVAISTYNLDLAFAWSRVEGFRITGIDGLGMQVFPLVAQFQDLINGARSGGCAQVVSDWLNGAATSTVKPALNGSPRRNGGLMHVPFKLTYDLRFEDRSIFTLDIPMEMVLDPPTSLDDLPGALWNSIFGSAEAIAGKVLDNPNAYYALALEVGRKAGASAFARMACRLFREGLEELAKQLVDEAEALPGDTIAAVAELAGVTVVVTLAGLDAVMNLFEQIWDDIKKLFGGGDDKKKQAEDLISQKRSQVQATLDTVSAKIDAAKKQLAISEFELALAGADGDLEVVGSITWAHGYQSEATAGGKLTLSVDYLSGPPGDRTGTVVLQDIGETTSLRRALADFPQGYGLNARIKVALTGFTFMDESTAGPIRTAIAQLRGLDDGVATDFADYLQQRYDEYSSYNANGIVGDYTYCTSDIPYYATVGASRIGVNTRVK